MKDASETHGAEALDPGVPQPIGRVQPWRVLGGEKLRTFDRNSAKHGIDQTFMRALADQIDGFANRGMSGNFEEQKLSDAESKRVSRTTGTVVQGPRQAACDERVDLAKAAQRRRNEIADQGPIADGERGKSLIGLEA